MTYTMKKQNIIKITDSEVKRSKLLALGFAEVQDAQKPVKQAGKRNDGTN